MNPDESLQASNDARDLDAHLRGLGVNASVGVAEAGALIVYAPNRYQERRARDAIGGEYANRKVTVTRARPR